MRRFCRCHIVGVFGLMRCDDVVAAVVKVHSVEGHLHSAFAAILVTPHGHDDRLDNFFVLPSKGD